MLRRSIDFVQTARGCVVQYSHKLSLTSRRDAALSVSVTKSPSLTHGRVPRCHGQKCAAARSAQHARGKVAESRSGVKAIRETLTRSLPLGFCSRSRASLFRSCKSVQSTKSLSLCSSTKSQAPAGGTTSGSRPSGRGGYHERVGEGETPLDLLRCCVRLTI